MELTAVLENINNNSIVTTKEQNSFLESTVGKIINTGLNTGIRALLPDLIEDQVINIKDAIINNGFQSGVKETISSAIELGKSAKGMITGKFENINQAKTVIKNGGLIDSISNAIDFGLSKIPKSSKIPSTVINVIKKGKDVLLDTINNNIEKDFDNQISSVEKLGKYSKQWKEYYNNKDFNGMEREYKKIENTLKEIMPMENTIKEARQIENLHTLIKNKGKNFDLSNEEIELAKKLTE